MSVFSGPQYPGAMRNHRVQKRDDAEDRRADFEIEVARVMFEQAIPEAQARPIAAASRRVRREVKRRILAGAR